MRKRSGTKDSAQNALRVGADGAWAHAMGLEGEMSITTGYAGQFAAGASQFSLPVLYPGAAISAVYGPAICAGSAASLCCSLC